jgi:hypothetical protein
LAQQFRKGILGNHHPAGAWWALGRDQAALNPPVYCFDADAEFVCDGGSG